MFQYIAKGICFTTIISLTGICGFILYKSTVIDEKKFNLVFDIDHTIIHSKNEESIENINKNIIKTPNYSFVLNNTKYLIWRRPFAKFILRQLSMYNNIYIYTAATQEYAEIILSNLFNNIKFKKNLYRNSSLYGKNLDKLNLDNSMTILFDDNKSNHVNKKNMFFHVYPYFFFNAFDVEMLNIYVYALLINIFGFNFTNKLYKNNILPTHNGKNIRKCANFEICEKLDI